METIKHILFDLAALSIGLLVTLSIAWATLITTTAGV